MAAAPTTAPTDGTDNAKLEDQTDDRKDAEEMVDILTQRGDSAVAQAIEKLYNKLDTLSEEDLEKLTAKMAAIKELNG